MAERQLEHRDHRVGDRPEVLEDVLPISQRHIGVVHVDGQGLVQEDGHAHLDHLSATGVHTFGLSALSSVTVFCSSSPPAESLADFDNHTPNLTG